jgi:predicted amidohydrolase YtcJ
VILAVGDNQTIKELAGSDTQWIDLDGKLVLPGMMDVHFHYYEWAMGRLNLNLAGLRSFQELIDLVKSAASEKPAGDWILGQGFNEADWPENRMPTRDDLDAAAPAHPVVLWRCDLHLAVVNSLALKRAGIDASTPDPAEGVITKDHSGRPNGILRELAINLVKDAIPGLSNDEIIAAMRDGMPVLHSLGITGVHDIRLMGGIEGATALGAWQRLRESGDLNLRSWVTLPGERIDEAVALGLRTGLGDDRLRIGHVKFFADGGMGARTAWMIEPYLDADHGMPLTSMTKLQEAVEKANQAGLAVAIHAVGDRTNRELIEVFEKLSKQRSEAGKSGFGPPAVAHRIEHVQMIRAEDLKRLACLDLVACVQPHNLILDMSMIDESVGSKAGYAYTFRDMLDAGITLCLSSDAPVCNPNPLVNIHAAVTRCRQDGTPTGGWYPRQKISVEEAVRAYTLTPALAGGVIDRLGSITAGKQADLIVIDRNIYDVDPTEIAGAKVDMTLFDGKIVYRRDSH